MLKKTEVLEGAWYLMGMARGAAGVLGEIPPLGAELANDSGGL